MNMISDSASRTIAHGFLFPFTFGHLYVEQIASSMIRPTGHVNNTSFGAVLEGRYFAWGC